jgi:cytochrome c'
MSMRTGMMVTAALLGLGIMTAVALADDEKATIEKMADALQKGNDSEARKMAGALKDADLEDIMNLMLPRKAKGGGGIGVGPKAGAIMPDGIEKKIQALEKVAPKGDEEMKALERAGYIMHAISLTVGDKVPKGKKPMPWKKYSADYEKAAKDFTDAAKKKDPKAIQAAAAKLNNACLQCHNDYK